VLLMGVIELMRRLTSNYSASSPFTLSASLLLLLLMLSATSRVSRENGLSRRVHNHRSAADRLCRAFDVVALCV